MRTKDIMTAVSLEEYLKEIMKISLSDGKKGKDLAAYNTSGGERKPSAAGKTREFGPSGRQKNIFRAITESRLHRKRSAMRWG